MTTAQFTTRSTYPQDWPAYNAAQTSEKDTFVSLLSDLCASIAQPDYSFGRPSLPLADMAYAATMKVYTGFSARRFDCVRGDGSAAKLQPYTSVETERGAGVGAFTHWAPPKWVRYQGLKLSNTTSLALMITDMLCYSATADAYVADYGTVCRVDMGNVGILKSG